MSKPAGPVDGHPVDDLAAYALDALDGAERAAVDEHLAGCEVCRAELAEHRDTLGALSPDDGPPPGVWQRIAGGIGAPGLPDPHAGADVRPGPEANGRSGAAGGGGEGNGEVVSLGERARSRRPPRLRWAVAAAALAVAGLAGGVVGFALGGAQDDDQDIGTLAQQASEQPEGVLATLADEAGQPVARVVADDDGAYIVLEGLDDLPEGRAYQLWSLTGPEPVSLGMLGRDGSNTVAFRLPPTITDLAISVAPTNGDTVPNGPFQASGDIARTS